MDWILEAHSGLRYLVLLVGVITLVHGVWGWVKRVPQTRTGARLTRAFAGVLDLQILLGVITLIVRAYYPALIGHIAMMVLAAVVLHAASVANRRRAVPSHAVQAIASLIALVLIAGGIMAIGRGIV